jgi:hypothetical protein
VVVHVGRLFPHPTYTAWWGTSELVAVGDATPIEKSEVWRRNGIVQCSSCSETKERKTLRLSYLFCQGQRQFRFADLCDEMFEHFEFSFFVSLIVYTVVFTLTVWTVRVLLAGVCFAPHCAQSIFASRHLFSHVYIWRGRDSVDGIATGYGLSDRRVGVRVPVWSIDVSTLCRPSLVSIGYRGPFPQG